MTDEHLAEQAAALINAAPDAIVAGPELPLQALQALTHTVPLVGMTEDMVAAGLVKSLAHPGERTPWVLACSRLQPLGNHRLTEKLIRSHCRRAGQVGGSDQLDRDLLQHSTEKRCDRGHVRGWSFQFLV